MRVGQGDDLALGACGIARCGEATSSGVRPSRHALARHRPQCPATRGLPKPRKSPIIFYIGG